MRWWGVACLGAALVLASPPPVRAQDLDGREKAAAAGDESAMVSLANLYRDGKDGVQQDYQKARHWYEKAAAIGNAEAMSNLGVLFRAGRGVAQDYQQARYWYQKAATQGRARAMSAAGRTLRGWQGRLAGLRAGAPLVREECHAPATPTP